MGSRSLTRKYAERLRMYPEGLSMLFILMIALFIIGFLSYQTCNIDRGFACYFFSVVFLFITLIVLLEYNETKATCDRKIVILEEKNELVLRQIEPIVNEYLTYESETLKELSSESVVALFKYPDLKGNEFLKSQIDVIIKNQDEITKLKLSKAELNKYKLWIFMGE